ncbi:MAG: Rieske 2Fe-2S domain-containing protein [Candidatus Melainabacteria bacterium]|nr:Rieske 2Fe-2S domain-containing protein [Candidatus Melainabacteria bacterium]
MAIDPVQRIALPTVAQSYVFRKNPNLGNVDELEKTVKVLKQGLYFDLEHFQSAKALPAEFYGEQVWKALRVMLRQNWLAVGHTKDLVKPFDYITLNFAGGLLLVIKDEKGKLHAFKNRCTHEKKILVAPPEYPEKGNLSAVKRLDNNKKILKCFYHGMKFKINDESPLTKYVVDTWGPLVFVLMQDLRNRPEQIELEKNRLQAMLAPLNEITKDMDISSFQTDDEEWNDSLKCHFALFDGNYCDAAHILETHFKTLAKTLVLPEYKCQYFGPASLQTCPVKEETSGIPGGAMAYYFKLPPTAAINIYKQNRDRNIPLPPRAINMDSIDTNIVRPIDRKDTVVTFGFHFPPGWHKLGILKKLLKLFGWDMSLSGKYKASSKRIQYEDRDRCENAQLGVENDLGDDIDNFGHFLKPEILKFAFQKWMVLELEQIVVEAKKG